MNPRLDETDDLRKRLAFNANTAFRVLILALLAKERPGDPARLRVEQDDINLVCATAPGRGNEEHLRLRVVWCRSSGKTGQLQRSSPLEGSASVRIHAAIPFLTFSAIIEIISYMIAAAVRAVI